MHIPLTSDHKGKGMAYVKFQHSPHAVEAFEKLDGTVFQGRLIHILPAIDRQSRSEADKKAGLNVTHIMFQLLFRHQRQESIVCLRRSPALTATFSEQHVGLESIN